MVERARMRRFVVKGHGGVRPATGSPTAVLAAVQITCNVTGWTPKLNKGFRAGGGPPGLTPMEPAGPASAQPGRFGRS